MNPIRHSLTGAARGVIALALSALAALAAAHGSNAGDIAIGHPFATPSIAGTTTGAAYFATLENTGATADKLLRASTPVAARVEIHTMSVDAQGVMRMREIDGIALAPKTKVQMRPGMGMHLMLIGVKEPLKEGATFPMTLQFERAGTVEVKVVVQTPRARGAAEEMHMH
ncbi:MAG TPA: copper chaperone PCu(A)C [Caldimonas sp.]